MARIYISQSSWSLEVSRRSRCFPLYSQASLPLISRTLNLSKPLKHRSQNTVPLYPMLFTLDTSKWQCKLKQCLINTFCGHLNDPGARRAICYGSLSCFELFYKNCKHSYLNCQLQSLNIFNAAPCVLSMTLWCINL